MEQLGNSSQMPQPSASMLVAGRFFRQQRQVTISDGLLLQCLGGVI